MVGTWCFGYCQGHQGTCWISLLAYSVLCTVEFLLLLYLLFVSWFICSMRYLMDKLGVFHANQTSICFDPHLNWGWGKQCETSLSTPVKVVVLTVLRQCLFCGSFLVFMFRVFHVFLSVDCSLVVTCWEGLTSWVSCMWCFIVFCHYPVWCLGSGAVLDCIDSWYLPSFLL